jgi:hypothetical protein
VTEGDEDTIRGIMHDLNTAWLQGRPQDLARWFHPDIVMVQPGFADRLHGNQAAIASYQEFLSAATIHAWDFDPPVVDVWGTTAVAACHFMLDYSISGQRTRDTGWDLFVFNRETGGWRAGWRTLLPHEHSPPTA